AQRKMRPRLARCRWQAQALLAWDRRPARGSTPRAGRVRRANAPHRQIGRGVVGRLRRRPAGPRDPGYDEAHVAGAPGSLWPYGWGSDHNCRLPRAYRGTSPCWDQGWHAADGAWSPAYRAALGREAGAYKPSAVYRAASTAETQGTAFDL